MLDLLHLPVRPRKHTLILQEHLLLVPAMIWVYSQGTASEDQLKYIHFLLLPCQKFTLTPPIPPIVHVSHCPQELIDMPHCEIESVACRAKLVPIWYSIVHRAAYSAFSLLCHRSLSFSFSPTHSLTQPPSPSPV